MFREEAKEGLFKKPDTAMIQYGLSLVFLNHTHTE